MAEIVAIGEILIDFTPVGLSDRGNIQFERNAGGAPLNMLTAAANLGAKATFIGKVGRDAFGDFLIETVKSKGIDATSVLVTEEANTTLAFVSLDANGDRSFSFYRNPGADMLLKFDEMDRELISGAKVFHFGSLSMTTPDCMETTHRAVSLAKSQGALISYDPNLRPPLWKSMEQAKQAILTGLPFADVLKISDYEITFLTGEEDLEQASAQLSRAYDIPLIIVTLGPKGAFYYHNGKTNCLPTYDVQVCDTTAAGDAFFGAVMYFLRDIGPSGIRSLSAQELERAIDFGNACGALTASKKGAADVVPRREEVEACMATVPKLIVQ